METGKHYYEKLADTEYGEILNSTIRWGHFKPDCISDNQWVYVLGEDALIYPHSALTAELAKKFIDRNRGWGYGVDDETETLVVDDVAPLHDISEAVLGDIPDPDKKFNKKVFEAERKAFNKVLGTVATRKEVARLSDRIMPVLQGRSVYSHFFRNIEVIGYTETTKRAGHQLYNMPHLISKFMLSPDMADQLHCSLEDMATRVHAQNIQKLEQFNFIPATKEYLLDIERKAFLANIALGEKRT